MAPSSRFSVQARPLLVLLACSACGQTTVDLDPPAEPAAVSVTPSSATLTSLADTIRLTVSVTYTEGAAPAEPGVQWSSTDVSVVTVDPAGLVTAVGPGAGYVRASAGNVSDSSMVEVDPQPARIDISPDAATFTSIQAERTFTATVSDAGGSPVSAPVQWVSLDQGVAEVDAGGVVTAVADGVALIVASSGSPADTLEVVVDQRATALVVGAPVGDVAPGLPVSIIATAVDSLGSAVATFASDVTIELDPNDQAATMTGVKTVAAQSGTASFPALEILRSGRGFTVTASSDELAGTSEPFDVRLRFASITVGASTVCALSFQGDVYCWGRNRTGGLGTGGTGDTSSPTLVTGGLSFVQIDAGHASNEGGWFDGFACGVTDQAEAYCWGHNLYGQLGNGTSGNDIGYPVLVAADLSWSSVVAARDHACGLTETGTAYCWGRNGGRLGNGAGQPDSDVPVPVSGGHTYTRLAAGLWNTCGVAADGTNYCWHSNDGLPGPLLVEPTPIPGTVELERIDPALGHLCGVSAAGDGYCWGRNGYGQLGVADTLARAEPTLVTGGHEWNSVRAGSENTCGLRVDGSAMCWGRDLNGETGQGDPGQEPALEPLPVVGGLVFTQIAGLSTWCGLVANGEAYCWGAGSEGTLGDGTFTRVAAIPVKVELPGSP